MAGVGRYITPVVDKHWVRNPMWPDLPQLSAGDNKFYGLFAVYEHLVNELDIQFTTTNNVLVKWGDGTSSSVPNNTDSTHTYVYSALTGVTLQDNGGYNYKPVIVEMDFSSTTICRISRTSASNPYAAVPWLDVAIDNSVMTGFEPSAVRKAQYLERLVVLNNNFGATDQSYAKDYMTSLKIMDFDFLDGTDMASMFYCLGDVRDVNENPLNINAPNCTTFNQAFTYSTLTELGDITAPAATTFYRMFFRTPLEVVGDITITGATTIQDMFYDCFNLRKIGTIYSSSALTNISSTFRFTRKCEDVTITDCSGVNNSTNAFVWATSYKNVILSGLTISIDVSGNDMSATAIDALFTSLGTANGTQTVTVTNNPGAATCTTSIATGKGWTVAT